jgi:hypothetical protein
MAERKAISGETLQCEGVYVFHPLRPPVTATITFYDDGSRDVGCPKMGTQGDYGICKAIPDGQRAQNRACVHLHPATAHRG